MLLKVAAADERRHGVSHLSQILSMDDLISQVTARCPTGTQIPSKACVRLQFAPKNPYTRTATKFTSRFDVQHKIQVCNKQFASLKYCFSTDMLP